MKIAELKQQLKPYVPEGWCMSEGFFLSPISGSASSGHVCIAPDCPREMKYGQRKEKYSSTVTALKQTLKKAGFKVGADPLTVYVYPEE